MEDLVSAGQNYRKILSVLLPAGALGMSLFLGAGGAEAAREMPSLASPPPVGERLAAIRDAVSDVTEEAAAPAAGAQRLAWGNWANFGIRLPFWNNWHNGWRNWGNNWHNGWNNWHNNWNNWNNWGNGWNNY
jgi:hypothetical protein